LLITMAVWASSGRSKRKGPRGPGACFRIPWGLSMGGCPPAPVVTMSPARRLGIPLWGPVDWRPARVTSLGSCHTPRPQDQVKRELPECQQAAGRGQDVGRTWAGRGKDHGGTGPVQFGGVNRVRSGTPGPSPGFRSWGGPACYLRYHAISARTNSPAPIAIAAPSSDPSPVICSV
jgi:hypothetical protein